MDATSNMEADKASVDEVMVGHWSSVNRPELALEENLYTDNAVATSKPLTDAAVTARVPGRANNSDKSDEEVMSEDIQGSSNHD